MVRESPFRLRRCLMPAVVVTLSGPRVGTSIRVAKSASVSPSRPWVVSAATRSKNASVERGTDPPIPSAREATQPEAGQLCRARFITEVQHEKRFCKKR